MVFCLQLPKIDDPKALWKKVEEFMEKYKKENPGPSKSDWLLNTSTWKVEAEVDFNWRENGTVLLCAYAGWRVRDQSACCKEIV